MTAKQKANRERFKKVVAEAKKLRKKNPKLTQAQAVKQAWAIMYSTKKVAGYSKERITIHKRATKWAKHIKSKNPNLDKKSVYARAYEHAGYGPLEQSKVGATKTKVKARKSKRNNEMHTDTKSHNVNIRVMSGVKNENLKQIDYINQHITKWRRFIYFLEDKLYHAKTKAEKTQIKKDLKEAKYNLKTLEYTLKEFKKLHK